MQIHVLHAEVIADTMWTSMVIVEGRAVKVIDLQLEWKQAPVHRESQALSVADGKRETLPLNRRKLLSHSLLR